MKNHWLLNCLYTLIKLECGAQVSQLYMGLMRSKDSRLFFLLSTIADKVFCDIAGMRGAADELYHSGGAFVLLVAKQTSILVR